MRTFTLLSIVLAATSLACQAATSSHSRVVRFHGGSAIITPVAGVDHVVIKDSAGNLLAESNCGDGSGTYDEIVTFLRKVKAVISGSRKASVSSLINYPLRVYVAPGKSRLVNSEHQLQAQYSTVFTPTVTREIRELNPHNVFCRNNMAMGDDGVIWVQKFGGQLKISVVNQ